MGHLAGEKTKLVMRAACRRPCVMGTVPERNANWLITQVFISSRMMPDVKKTLPSRKNIQRREQNTLSSVLHRLGHDNGSLHIIHLAGDLLHLSHFFLHRTERDGAIGDDEVNLHGALVR